jgi:hypothetical protein
MAIGSRASCPTHSTHVVFGHERKIVVDDKRSLRNVEAARGDVGGHQDRHMHQEIALPIERDRMNTVRDRPRHDVPVGHVDARASRVKAAKRRQEALVEHRSASSSTRISIADRSIVRRCR